MTFADVRCVLLAFNLSGICPGDLNAASAAPGAGRAEPFDFFDFARLEKMKLQRANYLANQLIPLAQTKAEISFGDRCRLISGGPVLLVVDVGPDPDHDLGADHIVVAYRSPCGVSEHRIRRDAVRRAPAPA